MCAAQFEIQQPSPGGPIYHLHEYYHRLSLGDRTNIARAFRGVPLISDPRFGDVCDWPAFEEYVSTSAAWLSTAGARFTDCETILGPARHILEGRLNRPAQEPGSFLPVILVGDLFAGGMKSLRIYHTLDAGVETAHPRTPLPPSPAAALPGSIQCFLDALSDGKPDEARQAFAGSSRLVALGVEDLEGYLQSQAANPDGAWQLCTHTSGNFRHALEFNLPDGYASRAGGCAVFELDPNGLIQRLRIYPAAR